MEVLKQYLSLLKGKEVVTKEEKDVLRNMLSEVEEDDKAKVEEEVAEVEAKPEEAEVDDGAEAELAEAKKKLSEATNKLSEVEKAALAKDQRLSEVENKLRKAELDKQADAFILSESNETGFVSKDKEAVVAFMLSLSDEQNKAFADVMKKVKTCKFGPSGKTQEVNLSEEAKEKEAEKLADKILSENSNLERWEALDKAYDQLGLK